MWAVSIRRSDAESLGRLWQMSGIEVCADSEDDNEIWLRGEDANDTLDMALCTLPGSRRFVVQPDRQLVPQGRTVPNGYLPEGHWIGLREWVSVDLLLAGFRAEMPSPVSLRLVRCQTPLEANVLIATHQTWSDYAATAPQFRLDRLAFAMDGARRVVVRGTPLPPIRGQRFVERQQVAVPVGWTWSPAVDAGVVAELLQLKPNDLALLYRNGSWEQVWADDFVRASRSAVRTSVGGVTDA